MANSIPKSLNAIWSRLYNFRLISLLVMPVSFTAQSNWQALLNDNLSHWDTYISFAHKDSYDGTPPKDIQGHLIAPIGLNTGNETLKIFTTLQQEGDTVLRISGEYYGAITSKKAYRNYHLKLSMRWGEKKWPPRLNKLKDSGILYHGIGPHGAEYFRSWMQSQEFQIMAGHIGDYWSQKNSAIDIRAYQGEYIMNPVANSEQSFLSFGHKQPNKGFVLRQKNLEKTEGQWNELELICFEGKSLHIVNGEVVMVLKLSLIHI